MKRPAFPPVEPAFEGTELEQLPDQGRKRLEQIIASMSITEIRIFLNEIERLLIARGVRINAIRD